MNANAILSKPFDDRRQQIIEQMEQQAEIERLRRELRVTCWEKIKRWFTEHVTRA